MGSRAGMERSQAGSRANVEFSQAGSRARVEISEAGSRTRVEGRIQGTCGVVPVNLGWVLSGLVWVRLPFLQDTGSQIQFF